jgi:hypothetical protein
MRSFIAILAALAATPAFAETVLGVYILSRHGDRTAKATPPTNLTDLGYEEVFTSGTYFRNRYIASGASNPIFGMNTDLVLESQITASAPADDNVLQNSAAGFLQALYPPVGEVLGSATLRNGTVVQTPLNGFQLIPIQTISTGTNSENSAWLQGSTGCLNAEISSNDYYSSSEYNQTYSTTKDFYSGIYPMVQRTYTRSSTNYKIAYLLFDLLNVASIHNTSNNFPDANLLTPSTFFQLRTLADQHEFNLAYNASQPIRAITGSIIAAQVIAALNTTITSSYQSKLNIQFNSYGGMQSFFGLANLTQENSDFFGVPDYASTLAWELVTNATVSATNLPSTDDISVRFLFHNGTTSDISTPTEYPLFGSGRSPLPWNDFVSGMNKFAIGNQADWCKACGNSTGVCSSASLGDGAGSLNNNGSTSSVCKSGGGGMSLAVAGVIGAMVTLAVILGIELLIILVSGFRLVSKKRLAGSGTGAVPGNGGVKA